LPPFGLFVSELLIVTGGFRSQQAWVSVVLLAALIAVFCGVLMKLSGLLPGPARPDHPHEQMPAGHVVAMSLPLVVLLVFSLWVPDALHQLLEQAADIIRGVP
jgi:hydrogenase-4 component F